MERERARGGDRNKWRERGENSRDEETDRQTDRQRQRDRQKFITQGFRHKCLPGNLCLIQ